MKVIMDLDIDYYYCDYNRGHCVFANQIDNRCKLFGEELERGPKEVGRRLIRCCSCTSTFVEEDEK